MPTSALRTWRVEVAVVTLACAISLVRARPYAGSWNDGSRLATAECLVDYGTLAIDDSIFVAEPPLADGALPPHRADDPILTEHGTRDKLLIDEHYYSDKSPVPSLWLAGGYKLVQWFSGLSARGQPGVFCWALTFASSGLAYVVFVWCVLRIARVAGLPLSWQFLLAAAAALGTLALPYVRHVNSHIQLLAVAAAAWLVVASHRLRPPDAGWNRPILKIGLLGLLAGLAYAIDLGAGPLLLVGLLALVIWRTRSAPAVAMFLIAAVPPVALHHAVNYVVGSSWKPANAIPEHFLWPDSPFSAKNITGLWHHAGFGRFLSYAGGMLFAKRGFLGHNLPVLLAPAGTWGLWMRCRHNRPEVLAAVGWCLATWLLYAAASNNSAGLCCSIRWLVPLLAPLFYLLALLLAERPDLRFDFLLLSFFSAALMAIAWWQGPWSPVKGWLYYPCLTTALGSWGVRRWRCWKRRVLVVGVPPVMARAA